MLNSVTSNNSDTKRFNAEFYLDPDQELTESMYEMRMNQLLAIITTVAFAIIAVAALTLTSFFTPTPIPFILLSTTSLIPVFKKYVYDYFREKETLYAKTVDIQKIVKKIFHDPKEIEGFSTFYSSIQVEKSENSEDLKKIRSIYAKYRTAEFLFESKNTEEPDIIDHNSIHEKPLNEKLDIIARNAIHKKSLNIEILEYKVKAAWYLHLLENPYCEENFNEKLKIYVIDPVIRLLGTYTSFNADIFLILTKGNASYTMTELQNKSIREISDLL